MENTLSNPEQENMLGDMVKPIPRTSEAEVTRDLVVGFENLAILGTTFQTYSPDNSFVTEANSEFFQREMKYLMPYLSELRDIFGRLRIRFGNSFFTSSELDNSVSSNFKQLKKKRNDLQYDLFKLIKKKSESLYIGLCKQTTHESYLRMFDQYCVVRCVSSYLRAGSSDIIPEEFKQKTIFHWAFDKAFKKNINLMTSLFNRGIHLIPYGLNHHKQFWREKIESISLACEKRKSQLVYQLEYLADFPKNTKLLELMSNEYFVKLSKLYLENESHRQFLIALNSVKLNLEEQVKEKHSDSIKEIFELGLELINATISIENDIINPPKDISEFRKFLSGLEAEISSPVGLERYLCDIYIIFRKKKVDLNFLTNPHQSAESGSKTFYNNIVEFQKVVQPQEVVQLSEVVQPEEDDEHLDDDSMVIV